MASKQDVPLLGIIRKAVFPFGDERASDRDLLRRFTQQRDEAAFSGLVRRHGAMVLGVALRVLRNRQDAEDVCQATFLVLARKANALAWRDSVVNWLYCVAYRLALKSKNASQRRNSHEKKLSPKSQSDVPASVALRELEVILDKELTRLPKKYADPLLLCCLEGRTRDEAARSLGLPLATVKSRLEHGREMLRRRLRRRGVELATLLASATLLSSSATAALPSSLVRAISGAALKTLMSESIAEIVSANVIVLIQKGIQTMWLAKISLAMVVLLVFGIGAAGIVSVLQSTAVLAQSGTPAKARTPNAAKQSPHDATFTRPVPVQAKAALKADDAIKAMETLEKRIERAQWEVKTRRGKLQTLDDVDSLIPSADFDSGWVVFEPRFGRYRVELDSVRRWVGGVDPFLAEKLAFAFDGEIFRNFSRQKPGVEFPEGKDHPGEGSLSKQDVTQLAHFRDNCGVRYFPPFFGDRPLSQILKEAQKKGDLVEISEGHDGEWKIKTNDPPASAYRGDPSADLNRGFVTLTYSPEKGAVASAIYAMGNPLQIWQRLVLDLQKVDGFWVPKSVRRINTIDKSISEIHYSKAQVNHAVEDAVFRFDFPRGAVITDHLEKKVYRAGLLVEDDQKAIQDYLVSQAPSSQGSATGRIRYLTIAAVVFSAIIAGLFWKRRRYRSEIRGSK